MYHSSSTKPKHLLTTTSLWLAAGITTCISSPTLATHLTLGTFGQTQLQQETGDSVQTTCIGFLNAGAPNPGAVPLFDTCGAMVRTANDLANGTTGNGLGLTADELAVSLQQIATEEFAATESMANEINASQAGNVITRLTELRRNVRGFNLAGLNYPGKNQTFAQNNMNYVHGTEARGGSAGADQPGGKLGGFINGSYSTGDRDRTDKTNQFDFDTYGITGGLDYRFTDNFVLGAAISYHDVDADFDNTPTVQGGGIDADGWGGFLYGTYYTGNLYVDALAGYAKSSYDTERKIVIASNNPGISAINDTAKGSPDSDDYTLSAGAGYALGKGSLSYGPYGRVSYYYVDVDDYQEKGAETSGLNLAVDGQTWSSLTSVLGAQISRAYSQSFGVLVPQAQAGWIHEFKNSSKRFSAVYVDDPRQNQLQARTNKPDHDYFEVGLGVAAVFRDGAQAFVNYSTVLGFSDLTEHVVTVGGRLEF